MNITNKWVGYIDRSYRQIKESIINRLKVNVPEIKDFTESNLLIILVSIFSGIAEMLNYYIDNMAREAFLSTARRYSSVIKHAKMFDYRVQAATPASADLTLNLLDSNGELKPSNTQYTLPINSIFYTKDNLIFQTTTNLFIPVGTKSLIIPVKQFERKYNVNLGLTLGIPDEYIIINDNYVEGTMILTIGGSTWELKHTLGLSGPLDKDFIIEIKEDGKAYIKFGDGINGKIPTSGENVVGSYLVTSGPAGNVEVGVISETDIDFAQLLGVDDFKITNNLPAVGGTNYQEIEAIRNSVPLHIRTLDRAVTRQDYIDVTKLAPGVDKAFLDFDCGKSIDIYISPDGGGIASSSLIASTTDYINDRKMVTTKVNILPAGLSYIHLHVFVLTTHNTNINIIEREIQVKLLEFYSYKNSDVNKPIYISDILALIDNINNVIHADIKDLYLIPYFKPLGHTSQLAITNFKILSYQAEPDITWKIIFMGNIFKIFKGQYNAGSVSPGGVFNNNEVTFKVPLQIFPNGTAWEFHTKAPNTNITQLDNTIPVLRLEDLIIELKKNDTIF